MEPIIYRVERGITDESRCDGALSTGSAQIEQIKWSLLAYFLFNWCRPKQRCILVMPYRKIPLTGVEEHHRRQLKFDPQKQEVE